MLKFRNKRERKEWLGLVEMLMPSVAEVDSDGVDRTVATWRRAVFVSAACDVADSILLAARARTKGEES